MTTIPPLFSLRTHRLRICVLLMFAVFHTVAMRVNLMMAIVAMVDVRNFREFWNTVDFDPTVFNETVRVDIDGGYTGTLLWIPPMQAIIFSGTFYGSLLTVFFTGKAIERLGAKAILAASIFVSMAATVATPILAESSFVALFVARMFMGAAESFVMPSIGVMASRWISPSERFAMMEMISSGNQLAASFSAVVTAALCLSPMGWQSVYYFYGLIASLWLVAWILLAANSPDKCRIVSESEAEFLSKTIPVKPSSSERIPWRSILTSRPFITCLFCQFAFVYSGTIMQGFLPTFLRAQLRIPLKMNGLFTLIPFGTMLIMKTLFSLLTRRFNSTKLSTPTGRAKLFQSLSSIGCILAMISMVFFANPNQLWIAIISLAVFGVSLAAAIPGFALSTQSLSPQHSLAINQISAVTGVVAAICAPMIMWLIMTLKVNGVVESIWKTAFSVACALNLIAGVMFILFGDGSSSFLVVENTQLQLVIKDGEMKKGQGNREYTQSKGLRKENEIR
ncbi:hypothetical protein PRIPAC_78219 [Pristionchus pacificus]|nr:hypothetical protein PRIPAC_78219 [Pristionchus pacificus]